jgi:hypothetical protein
MKRKKGRVGGEEGGSGDDDDDEAGVKRVTASKRRKFAL